MDGNIGQITIDLKGQVGVTDGHKVLATKEAGAIQFESTRWPFCFDGDTTSAGGTRSITPFLTFNQDLNRLTLTVKNLEAPKAKVTWGEASKEFTKEQLAGGVNLAAEFDQTPFDKPFADLVNAVGQKQNFETYMIKNVITQFRNYPPELKADAELQSALKTVSERLHARQAELDAAARATLLPVKHAISVTPVP